ncbi:MAG: hypothetical protein ABIZ91_13255 [Gemmatimonadaceae bacterium]
MPTTFNFVQRALVGATVGSLILTACGTDVPTAPGVRAPAFENASTALQSDAASPFVVLGRSAGLKKDVTVSASIGAAGGTLKISSAGLTLVIPPGAVTETVNFSVTALAGPAVAYEFAPHGMTFLKPLEFRQKLRDTNWSAAALGGGYFKERGQVNNDGLTAVLNENLEATIKDEADVEVDGKYVTFGIWHFSGYLVSSGRSQS